MTTVLNLATGEERIYSLPPDQAVKAAYRQARYRDMNTWDYANTPYSVPYVKTKLGHNCGDWAALDKDYFAEAYTIYE
jgi:hypothetical protein